MVPDQVTARHRVDLQGLVPVEVYESEGEQVEQFSPGVRAQDQVLTVVEEKHKVGLILVGKDDGSHTFDLVKAGLFAGAACSDFVSVDVICGLDVDSRVVLAWRVR